MYCTFTFKDREADGAGKQRFSAECVKYESSLRAERSNPAEARAAKLDCLATLAMTGAMQIYGVLL